MYLDDRQADWLCSLLWEDWNLQAMSAGKFKTSVQEAIWMVCCYCCCCSWWWWMRYHLSVVCGVGLRWLRSPLWDQRELDSCHSRGSKMGMKLNCIGYSRWFQNVSDIHFWLLLCWANVFIPEVWLVFCWDASLCEKWGQLEGRSTIFKTGIFDLFFGRISAGRSWFSFSQQDQATDIYPMFFAINMSCLPYFTYEKTSGVPLFSGFSKEITWIRSRPKSKGTCNLHNRTPAECHFWRDDGKSPSFLEFFSWEHIIF